MSIKKIENGRAAFAFIVVYEALKDYERNNKENIKLYRSYIKKMPMMINVNGLAQTLAFYFSKGEKDPHYKIYQQLEDWINNHYRKQLTLPERNRQEKFIKIIVNLDRDEYRMITIEILNLLNWMNRFVEGLVKTEYKYLYNDSE